MGIRVREIELADIPAACEILNDIIWIGGTTALEQELDEVMFAQYYVTGKDLIACHVAPDPQGQVAGLGLSAWHIQVERKSLQKSLPLSHSM